MYVERDELEKMAAMWTKQGEAIEKVRSEALANYDVAANRGRIDALLTLACERREPRLTSGMVEMQRYFAKAWS